MCEQSLKELQTPPSEERYARECLHKFLSSMQELDLSQTGDILFAVPRILEWNRVFICPMPADMFRCIVEKDIDPTCDELYKYRHTLKYMPLENVLGMRIIWGEDDLAQITDEFLEQLAVSILLELTFFGLDVETRQRNLDTLKRTVMLAVETNEKSSFPVSRVLPWFVDGTPVIKLSKYLGELRNDQHYTVYKVFCDIWGVINWTPVQYRILIYVLSNTIKLIDGNPRTNISMQKLTETCRCSIDDVEEMLRKVEACFTWIDDNQPRRIKLICGHTVDDGWLYLQLDGSLIKLYKTISTHAKKATDIIIMRTQGEMDLSPMLLLELLTTYMDRNIYDNPEIYLPTITLMQNLPISD